MTYDWIAWMCHSGVECGVDAIRKCEDLALLKQALDIERSGPDRKGLVRAMLVRIRRLEREAGK